VASRAAGAEYATKTGAQPDEVFRPRIVPIPEPGGLWHTCIHGLEINNLHDSPNHKLLQVYYTRRCKQLQRSDKFTTQATLLLSEYA
jgi:hypothetical protein